MGTNTVSNVGWKERGWTNLETKVTIVPHPVKKRRMCQHRKRAVARRALIREDQKPLPLPVKGSTPECIAWTGIAEAIVVRANVDKEQEGFEGRQLGFSTRVSLSIYLPC
jgi:hypothetical protein